MYVLTLDCIEESNCLFWFMHVYNQNVVKSFNFSVTNPTYNADFLFTVLYLSPSSSGELNTIEGGVCM